MENIDRWLKSLRLHKYTPLFRAMSYEEMLNLHEKFLIDMDITKGARNKILVSIKKLNLRHDRLVNMIDDINQDNISMKEALTVMKEMLITPIPRPLDWSAPSPTISLPDSLSSSSSSSSTTSPSSGSSSSGCSTSGYDNTDSYSIASTGSSSTSPTIPGDSTAFGASSSRSTPIMAAVGAITGAASGSTTSPSLSGISSSGISSYCSDPYELTYLFVETFEKLAQRLIDSGGFEDNACHGIMAAIVDECLKHNSFTKEQKARVARYRYHHSGSSSSSSMSNHHNYNYPHQPIMMMAATTTTTTAAAAMRDQMMTKSRMPSRYTSGTNSNCLQQQIVREQKVRLVGNIRHNSHHHHHPFMRQSYQQQQQQLPYQTQHLKQQYHRHPQQQQLHHQEYHPLSQQNHFQRQQQQHQPHKNVTPTYREYSLLGPGLTFELPCLRAKAEAERRNRPTELSFFSGSTVAAAVGGSARTVA